MSKATTVYLADYQPPTYFIKTTQLTLDLSPEATVVGNTMRIERAADAAVDAPLILDGEGLILKTILLDEVALSEKDYRQTDSQLILPHFPKAATLSITTEISPVKNTALEGLYMSNGRFFTQCESQGFRRITYYCDRPDVLSVFTTTVRGCRKQYPYCLANGNMLESGCDEKTDQHWFTWHNPHPMPSYLFACVAGQFSEQTDTFTTSSGKRVALKMYVEPRNASKCAHALRALKLAMRFDEQRYSREYDLDNYMICAVDDFNSGAMENKGLNIFNSECVLANEETATDADFELIDAVVAHEYFHNWTGNRVTCRDWFQLCLKEGLTVFREQQFMETVALPVAQRINDVRILQTHQFAEDAGPTAHSVRPDHYQQIRNFYTSTVYNKGAEIYRMLWYLVGEQGFHKGMTGYFDTFDGCAVTIEQFIENMQTTSGKDLSQFHHWLTQAGTPEVTLSSRYDASAKTLTLHIAQQTAPTPGQPNKQPMQFPLAFGLLKANGEALSAQCNDAAVDVAAGVVEVTQAEHRFTLTGVDEKPVLSLLRGFSAPVKLTYDYADAELLFLWQYDSDDFNRWSAGQRYLTRRIFAAVDDAKQAPLNDEGLQVIQALLANEQLNPAFVAELITLPSETALMGERSPVPLDRLIEVRDAAKLAIANTCQPLLITRYQQCVSDATTPGKYARALQNRCLDYLSVLANQTSIDLCVRQFETAKNMTERLGALQALSHKDCSQREKMLAAFYQQYCDDPIVVNKWLRVQAQATLPATIDAVKQLMTHDSFTINNPNKVRALVGVFCQHNARHFHASDGRGYQLLADTIMTLNDLNPQMGARMVNPLTQWRRFDSARASMMRAALQSIQDMPNLSSDVNEMVTKALAD